MTSCFGHFRRSILLRTTPAHRSKQKKFCPSENWHYRYHIAGKLARFLFGDLAIAILNSPNIKSCSAGQLATQVEGTILVLKEKYVPVYTLDVMSGICLPLSR